MRLHRLHRLLSTSIPYIYRPISDTTDTERKNRRISTAAPKGNNNNLRFAAAELIISFRYRFYLSMCVFVCIVGWITNNPQKNIRRRVNSTVSVKKKKNNKEGHFKAIFHLLFLALDVEMVWGKIAIGPSHTGVVCVVIRRERSTDRAWGEQWRERSHFILFSVSIPTQHAKMSKYRSRKNSRV